MYTANWYGFLAKIFTEPCYFYIANKKFPVYFFYLNKINWFSPQDFVDPIMCSYKAVKVKFEVWGLQTKVEEFTHRVSNQLHNFLTF